MIARVLITCPQMQRDVTPYVDRLEALGIETEVPPVVQVLDEDELIAIIDRFDGVIVGDDPVTRQVLEHATRLRVVSKWGVGVDNIDLEAAAELGIRVTNTPGTFGDEVADVVIGYLVLLARQLHRTDAVLGQATGQRSRASRWLDARSASWVSDRSARRSPAALSPWG